MSQGFDLNLLRVLSVLIEEQSVTKTAQRLFVTQSAVSKSLAKLRVVFADPIFIKQGKVLLPTPKALALAPQLKQIMQNIDTLVLPAEFDPQTSERRFKFDMMEVAYAITLPKLMPKLLEVAPSVKLETTTWNESTTNKLLNCEIDFAIKCMETDKRSVNHVSSLPKTLNYAELGRDYAVCVVRKDHPAATGTWTINDYLKLKHIQVTGGGNRHWLVDEILMQKGIQRNIVLEVPDFHSAFKLCENTDLVLFAPHKQVECIVDNYELTTIDVPVEMQNGVYVIIWNQYFDQDPAHTWLRELVIENTQ